MYYIAGFLFCGFISTLCLALCKAAAKEEEYYSQVARKNKN
ncbi:hypothetical protein [Clostridium manihotivorum]|nr:hypothetical protein [Clostridium manihotivorum]